MNRLLSDLLAARNDGSWAKLLDALKKQDLLILKGGLACADIFTPFDALYCRDLLEITDDRYGHGSILITAQLPASGWRCVFVGTTLAEALLDRACAQFTSP